jgi:oligoendopeptidase F
VKASTYPILLLFLLFLPFALSIGSSALSARSGGSVPRREEIEVRYTWDPSDLFESDEAWEKAYRDVEARIARFAEYEGAIGKSAAALLACLRLRDDVGIRMVRLSSYTARKRDVDLSNATYQAMTQRMQSLATNRAEATAFIEPGILAIPDDRLAGFLREEEGLRLYEHAFDDLRRLRGHVLSVEEEELLSLAGEVMAGAGAAFGMLTNADFEWGRIVDESGQEVQMSRSRYLLYMGSPDRRVRRDAYRALYVPFERHLNTLSTLLVTSLKSHIFLMKARKYDSSLEAALSIPNIPTDVYHNLIRTLNDNLDPLHRWAALKKRVLGLDELHPYDTYAPLFPDVRRMYTYEEAQAIVLEALRPMGSEVAEIIERAFRERWIDVFENVGKRGGAYSSGTYGVHPYILMNFNGTISSVFTLAHELGHAVHSYLSSANQPYVYSGYATFNAEVASTTNEALLMDYMLDRAESDEERLMLLQKSVQNIGSTFYRQGRFAEFELAIHEAAEREEPLTRENLSALFGELYRKYWGPEMVVDPQEEISWTRIPHFHYNYYIYTYATSFAASQLIAKKIREEGRPAVDAYLKFLSSGGSDYPIELLRAAGVDMSTPEPIVATTQRMDALIDRMEAILARK